MNLGKTVTYSGEILDCVKQGRGSYKYPGGVYQYEGPWVDGKKHGSGGKFSLIGGDSYEGEFTNGEITGKGTKTWADGRSYTGDFLSGEMCGKGVWTSSNGNEVYEGDFDSNRREGHGHNRLPNGDTFNGAFSRHKFHGEGSYLRENCFIITSTFEAGVAHGKGSVKWHKAGSYDGNLSNGCMHGSGVYSAFNGTYVYSGEFVENTPAYSVEKLNLFVDKRFISEPVDEDPKAKKKAAKPKKGDASADALATVAPGHEVGKVVFLMNTDKSDPLDEHAGEWTVPLSVPNQHEQHRSMRLRLREYFPPPPPGKGEAPREPDPDTELGAVIPFWQRKPSLEVKCSAWARFPVSKCIRYINGVDVLTGEQVTIEGATESFTKDESGLTSAKVPQAADASVSICFVPSVLEQAHERLAIIVDFKLAVGATTQFSKSEVGSVSYDDVPILSLCNKVEGLEGKSRLELVLLKPGSDVVVSQPEGEEVTKEEDMDDNVEVETPPEQPWTECLWELRLCEDVLVEVTPTENDEEDSVAENKQDVDTEEKEIEEPQYTQTSTVLSRWAESCAFDSTMWHSIAVTLQASTGDDSSNMTGNVELSVDGTGRMKVDGPFEEGIAAAWLPAPPSTEVVENVNTETTEGSSETEKSPESVVSMVFRVGKGDSFGGLVKSLVLVAGKSGSTQDMTAVFVPDPVPEDVTSIGMSESVEESVDDQDDEEKQVDAPPPVPDDCAVVEEVEFVTCGGRGSVDGLLIPAGTKSGIYVLEVLDNVDEQCVRDAPPGPASDEVESGVGQLQLKPGDLAPLCKLVPPAGSSLMTYKLVVE